MRKEYAVTRFVAALSWIVLALLPSVASAAEVIAVYGPGGPLPAMKEAAAAFQKSTGVVVNVTGGPMPQWIARAKADADLIFSGSENMMTSFVRALGGDIVESSIDPLYIRPSAILVRPGNPKKIAGVRDLLKPGMRILVVEGAGQIGVWEDVAGRLGDIATVRAFRENIVAFSENSGEAKGLWAKDPKLDAWLIWNIWEIANDELADAVEVEPELRIWRDCGIALTRRGAAKKSAAQFVDFLKSPAGRAIFERWGWK